jgi:hypothetical protein
VRCRSTASNRRAFATAIAAWSAKGLDERDVLVGEGLQFTANENDDADEVVLDHDRDRDQRSVALPRAAIGVFRSF